MEDDDDDTHNGPLLEKPPVLNTDPNGLEVGSMTYSINDKALGSGDPIRVREGQRLLIHFLNASAIENRRIALAGHKMKVIALDGNPVPTPQTARFDLSRRGRTYRRRRRDEPSRGLDPWLNREDGSRVGPRRRGRVRRAAPPAAMDRPTESAVGLHHLWYTDFRFTAPLTADRPSN